MEQMWVLISAFSVIKLEYLTNKSILPKAFHNNNFTSVIIR